MPYSFDHDTTNRRRQDAEHDPLIGTVLDDRYRFEERIATGGFGAIYRARTASGQAVALKILHPRLTGDPTVVARFRREGAILTQLHDPHTVATLAVGETEDGTLYIAMELLSGESLQAHLHRAGALPWQTAVAIARAVCSSLAEAHALGVVHRDLKPANIHVECRGGAVQVVKVPRQEALPPLPPWLLPPLIPPVRPASGSPPPSPAPVRARWWITAAILGVTVIAIAAIRWLVG